MKLKIIFALALLAITATAADLMVLDANYETGRVRGRSPEGIYDLTNGPALTSFTNAFNGALANLQLRGYPVVRVIYWPHGVPSESQSLMPTVRVVSTNNVMNAYQPQSPGWSAFTNQLSEALSIFREHASQVRKLPQ